ncbi:hypothetical protein L596_017485 [Steinernema carpocapsae]|uniref:Uncharacterized protein n=1 Tax=Steinernema carpocapsae TaxID=34508 RepID=A0A4U5N2K1_STECR|nr:hypothetical protein L596_017485 [Steinernema carpocapsae]
MDIKRTVNIAKQIWKVSLAVNRVSQEAKTYFTALKYCSTLIMNALSSNNARLTHNLIDSLKTLKNENSVLFRSTLSPRSSPPLTQIRRILFRLLFKEQSIERVKGES